MVTIEQKLSLFSKLLQQDIKSEIGEKIQSMEREYEEIMAENKRKVDKDARAIIERSRKKGEEKRLELLSKAKMQTKKQTMVTKEKYIGIFIEHLKDRIRTFTVTPEYKVYLGKLLSSLEELSEYQTAFIVYMTETDSKVYGNYVLEGIKAKGVEASHLELEVKDDMMVGGFILDNPERNLRIDLSINTLLEDYKDEIVEELFNAIGEVGGLDE